LPVVVPDDAIHGQLCEFLQIWSTVKGGMLGDHRGQEALLSPLEGGFTEEQDSAMGAVEFALGVCLWTAGRGAEGEPLFRSLLRRRSVSMIARVKAREHMADSALQRGDMDEATRLCDLALALTGETPDAFEVPLSSAHPNTRASMWAECRAPVLALRGGVEECRGNLVGAWRYDEQAQAMFDKHGASFPVDSHRRHVLYLLRGGVDPRFVAAEVRSFLKRYVETYADEGLTLFKRRDLEGWARALREVAAALRASGWLGGLGVKEVEAMAEAMAGEAADIEGIFDALKAAVLAEARAAVAQERSSRQQRRAVEGALPELPAPPAKLTKSQKKRARQKAARAAFVPGGGDEGGGAEGDEASTAPGAADASIAVGEGQEEGQGQAVPPPSPDPPVDVTASAEECALCLVPMATGDPSSEAEAVVVGCGHQFHGMCMGMWTATCAAKGLPYTCPLCRHFL
jgi:hypothetical protein